MSSATDDCGHWPQRGCASAPSTCARVRLRRQCCCRPTLPTARGSAPAAATIAPVGIQLSGNYGVFNATAALAVPLFAPTTSAAAAASAAVGLLVLYMFLSLLHPALDASVAVYRRIWSTGCRRRCARRRARLALARARAPWRVCHAWGVSLRLPFTAPTAAAHRHLGLFGRQVAAAPRTVPRRRPRPRAAGTAADTRRASAAVGAAPAAPRPPPPTRRCASTSPRRRCPPATTRAACPSADGVGPRCSRCSTPRRARCARVRAADARRVWRGVGALRHRRGGLAAGAWRRRPGRRI